MVRLIGDSLGEPLGRTLGWSDGKLLGAPVGNEDGKHTGVLRCGCTGWHPRRRPRWCPSVGVVLGEGEGKFDGESDGFVLGNVLSLSVGPLVGVLEGEREGTFRRKLGLGSLGGNCARTFRRTRC